MITKTALDTVTDQVLAGLRQQREHGVPAERLLAELGAAYADQLAVQFPGDVEAAGRALASASALLHGAADVLPSADAAVLVAGFAGEALTRKAAGR